MLRSYRALYFRPEGRGFMAHLINYPGVTSSLTRDEKAMVTIMTLFVCLHAGPETVFQRL